MLIRFHFVLPPSAQRFVDGDQSRDGARLAGGKTVLRFKQRAFGIEHAEKNPSLRLRSVGARDPLLSDWLRQKFSRTVPVIALVPNPPARLPFLPTPSERFAVKSQ